MNSIIIEKKTIIDDYLKNQGEIINNFDEE